MLILNGLRFAKNHPRCDYFEPADFKESEALSVIAIAGIGGVLGSLDGSKECDSYPFPDRDGCRTPEIVVTSRYSN